MLTKTLIAVGLVAATGVAAGCGGRGYHGSQDPAKMKRFVDRRVDDALDDLNANDAQRAKVNPIKERLFADATAMLAEHKQAREETLQLWTAPTADPAKARALVDKRVEAIRALGYKVADAAVELHGVLTPEQRAQVAEKAKERGGCGR